MSNGEGIYKENLILAKLALKCDIKQNEVFDHTYKLDLVIDRFKEIDRLSYIGVQLTTRPGDITKQKIFLAERSKKTLVDRSLYIEIHPDVDIITYGAELVYNALVAFAFQKDLRSKEILGVRIKPDVTYSFYDIGQVVEGYTRQPVVEQREEKPMETPKSTGKKILFGRVTAFSAKSGYGFIEAEQDKQSFFLHISNVSDSMLKKLLADLEVGGGWEAKSGDTLCVEFENGGAVRGRKYPLATNVKYSLRSLKDAKSYQKIKTLM